MIPEKIHHDNLPQDLLEAIYALNDVSRAIVVIAGRVIVVTGDVQMADEFQSINEHFIEGKDITSYIISHAINLSAGRAVEAFLEHEASNLRRRLFRFHKDERYARFSNTSR